MESTAETPPVAPTTQFTRKLAPTVWLLGGMLLVGAHLYPIRSTLIRAAILLLYVGLWLGALLLFRKRVARIAFIGVAALAIALFALPGRASDPNALRQEYVRSLRGYEGVAYVWGGEGHLGIDCSGLMRAGLVDAEVKRGLTTFNPGVLRSAVSLWWHDEGATAMKDEYRHLTHKLFDAPDLNTLDYARIQSGDMAVLGGGAHVIAYIGDQTWIEADPGEQRVVQIKAPSKNTWLHQHAALVRWRQFEPDNSP